MHKLLRLHLSESDSFKGSPLYEAIVDKCRELGISGATVFRGLEGYGETAEIHRHRVLRHDQPVVIVIIDEQQALDRLLLAIEPIMTTGLIAISEVSVKRVQRS